MPAPRSPGRLVAGLIGAGAALVALAWTLLALVPELQAAQRLVAMFASFIPLALPAWALALAGASWAARGRLRAALAVPCLVGVLLHTGLAARYVPHAAPAAAGERLRILTLNTLYGKVDAVRLTQLLAAEAPDVVVLVEAEQPLLDRLEAAGALAAYPARVGHVEPGWGVTGAESAAGTLVLSRTPLTELERLPSLLGQYVVRVERPGADVTLVAAHPMNMVPGASVWTAEGDLLADAARRHTASGPLVVAGDLNAVPEHVTFRRLIATGLQDAAAASGAGWLPTYPAQGAVPPLLPIDHVLTNDRITPVAVRAIAVANTDHRGLVADLVIRP